MIYGYCPMCGAKGVSRERRPNGDDKCEHGHAYPSLSARPTSEREARQLHARLTAYPLPQDALIVGSRCKINATEERGLIMAFFISGVVWVIVKLDHIDRPMLVDPDVLVPE